MPRHQQLRQMAYFTALNKENASGFSDLLERAGTHVSQGEGRTSLVSPRKDVTC